MTASTLKELTLESKLANIRQVIVDQLDMQFGITVGHDRQRLVEDLHLHPGQIARLHGILLNKFPFLKSSAALAQGHTVGNLVDVIVQQVGL